MKKWFLILLAALLLTGCGSRGGEKVAICLSRCDDSAAVERLEALRAALTAAGYEVAAADAEQDQSRQDRQLADLLDAGYELLIVEPVLLETAPRIAQLAAEEKVPVIFLGYEPEAVDGCYVGSREEQAGAAQAQVLQALPAGGDLNGDGILRYAVIAGPEDHADAMARTQGCLAAVAGECLEVCYTDWSRESAQTACARLLAAYGKDLEAVLCNSDTLAMGAMAAMEKGGREVNETVYLVGLEGSFQGRLLVRSGDMSGTVYLPPAELAQAVTRQAEALLAGEPADNYYGAYIPLTQETVDAYITD